MAQGSKDLINQDFVGVKVLQTTDRQVRETRETRQPAPPARALRYPSVSRRRCHPSSRRGDWASPPVPAPLPQALAYNAAAAGFVMLSMVNFVLLIIVGFDKDAQPILLRQPLLGEHNALTEQI